MATSAERQKAYRARRATAGEGGNGERLLNTWLNTEASLALKRLSAHHGVTQRAMLEKMITAADRSITGRLDPDSTEWAGYFGVTR